MVQQLYSEKQLEKFSIIELRAACDALCIPRRRSKVDCIEDILAAQPQKVAEVQTDDYLFHNEQPSNLAKVGDSYFIGEFLLRCSQVGGIDYAVTWDVYDENNALMNQISMGWDCYWTHPLSFNKFCTPQQATVDLHASLQAYRQECAIREDRAKTIEVIEQRENEVAHGGNPQDRTSEFVVRNQDNGNQYVVCPNHPESNQRCECPDCYHRSTKCKHQIAVELFLQRQQLEKIIAATPSEPTQPARKDYGYEVKIKSNGKDYHFEWLKSEVQVLANLRINFSSGEIANAIITPLPQDIIANLEAEYEKDWDSY